MCVCGYFVWMDCKSSEKREREKKVEGLSLCDYNIMLGNGMLAPPPPHVHTHQHISIIVENPPRPSPLRVVVKEWAMSHPPPSTRMKKKVLWMLSSLLLLCSPRTLVCSFFPLLCAHIMMVIVLTCSHICTHLIFMHTHTERRDRHKAKIKTTTLTNWSFPEMPKSHEL